MVYVRVKPLMQQQQDDARSIIDVIDDKMLIFDPLDYDNQRAQYHYYHGKKYKEIGPRPNKNAKYIFDKVFDETADNFYIYETVTKPMIQATVDGLNCSVFAYGATGSGKTHTMLGSPEHPGVIYHTARELFRQIMTLTEIDAFPPEIKIGFFEIYNENIRDLLDNRKKFTSLPVREGPTEVIIPDLTFHQPSSAENVIELLEVGNANRSQHPTDANADSSRSHAIFQIYLTRKLLSSSQDICLQKSKMSLIDLAGSERASVAYRAGIDRSKNLQREGGNINKSLLALSNCINALADARRNNNHIPYRNSKLTLLLRDSLGGKCRTAMIATICQQHKHYEESHNTLMYANRAKCIKLRPGRNLTNVNIQPRNYTEIIDNLTKKNMLLARENESLKNTIAQMQYDLQEREQKERYLLAAHHHDEQQQHHNHLPQQQVQKTVSWSTNLTSMTNYTPEQSPSEPSNVTFDLSNHEVHRTYIFDSYDERWKQ